MPGERCTMPHCCNDQEYPGIGVCRICYHRIYWVSKNYHKTMEKAKAALAEIDSAAIKHGLVTEDNDVYSRRRSFTS